MSSPREEVNLLQRSPRAPSAPKNLAVVPNRKRQSGGKPRALQITPGEGQPPAVPARHFSSRRKPVPHGPARPRFPLRADGVERDLRRTCAPTARNPQGISGGPRAPATSARGANSSSAAPAGSLRRFPASANRKDAETPASAAPRESSANGRRKADRASADARCATVSHHRGIGIS